MARWLAVGLLLLTGCALDLGGLGESAHEVGAVDGGSPAHPPLAPQPEAGGSFVVDSGTSESTFPDAGAAALDSGGPSSPDPVGEDAGGDPGAQNGDDSGDQGPGKGNGHHG